MGYLIDLARHAQPESDRLCRFLRFHAHPALAFGFTQDVIFLIPSMILGTWEDPRIATSEPPNF
jgi:hypothetical protein